MNKITLKDLHELNNKYPKLKDMHLTHQYDSKTKEWKFVGHSCSKCGRVFKKEMYIEKHEDSCRPLQKLNKAEEQAPNIKNLKGEPWKPRV
jgi:hypothetical protein